MCYFEDAHMGLCVISSCMFFVKYEDAHMGVCLISSCMFFVKYEDAHIGIWIYLHIPKYISDI